MLFAIQLVRVVLGNLLLAVPNTKNLAVGINQMFNVIIRSFRFYFFCFTDNFYLARASHQQ